MPWVQLPSPPPCPSPPKGRRFPPTPGGTVHHSRPANSSITQPKIFFSAFGACDFLLISYCSWAKGRFPPWGGGDGHGGGMVHAHC